MSQLNTNKRIKRIRRKLKLVNKEGFRLSVFRSSKNLSAQIILKFIIIIRLFLMNVAKIQQKNLYFICFFAINRWLR